MRRLAIFLFVAIAATMTISATPAPGCDLLKHLLHRCHSCYQCGAHKCSYAKCHRPKCHCGEVQYPAYGPSHYGHGHGLFGHKHYRQRGYYGGPAYVEPSAPVYEEIVPGGRDF